MRRRLRFRRLAARSDRRVRRCKGVAPGAIPRRLAGEAGGADVTVAPAYDSRPGTRPFRARQRLLIPINLLLTITPQHCPTIKSRHGLGPKARLIVHLGGGQRLAGLQGVTSCRHLAYDTAQVCLPNSSRRFSARLVWASRLRLRSSGFVPDRSAACLRQRSSVRAWCAMADKDWSYSLAALPCCRRLRAAGFPRRELMGRS
jgi:hypothetical protein